jgi:hypothetical protein
MIIINDNDNDHNNIIMLMIIKVMNSKKNLLPALLRAHTRAGPPVAVQPTSAVWRTTFPSQIQNPQRVAFYANALPQKVRVETLEMHIAKCIANA